MKTNLPRPLPVYDVNSDRFPIDDYWIEKWKRTILKPYRSGMALRCYR